MLLWKGNPGHIGVHWDQLCFFCILVTSQKTFIRRSDYSLMILLYSIIGYKQQSRLPNPPAGPPDTRNMGKRLRNGNKCQILHITRACTPIRHQFVLHGQLLEAVDHGTYLGLEISHDLNWNTHIQTLTTKANRTLGFVRRNIQTKYQGIRQTPYANTI